MIELWGYFAISIVFALLITPLMRKLAYRWKVFAHVNHRTMHSGITPKLGGGAIILAFIATLLVIWYMQPEIFSQWQAQLLTLTFGMMVLFIMGTIDDKMDLGCNLKISIEFIVATLAVLSGWRIETIVLPSALELGLGYFTYPVSIFWIVGIVNAINMIDGLDGLAPGIVIVISLISAAIAALFGHTWLVFVAVLVAGAVIGFLRYNFFPASIFMGDSGSLPLGFLLACITFNAAAITPGKVAVIVPLLLLGLPITDTLLAIIRRIRKGIHPFHADREHIHHRLVKLGLSQAGAALFMVGVTIVLGVIAFLFAQGIHTEVKLFQPFITAP